MDRVRLALYQPDIAPNVGAAIRLGACLGAPVDVIEPCGFAFSLHAVRRQVMDYAALAEIVRHDSWGAFQAARAGRLVVLTTRAGAAVWDFAFRPGDTLLVGRESAGLPDAVHGAADARLAVPMTAGARSLNVVTAAAIALGEAARQLGSPPRPGAPGRTVPVD